MQHVYDTWIGEHLKVSFVVETEEVSSTVRCELDGLQALV